MAREEDFQLSSYRYDLPSGLIARHPRPDRSSAKLLVLGREGAPRHAVFADIASFLPENALLVANNARVVPCRMSGRRPGGGKAEFLLLTPLPLALAGQADAGSGWSGSMVECLLKPAAKIRPGDVVELASDLCLEAVARYEFGRYEARLRWRGNLEAIFSRDGQLPLPPYLRRPASDEDSGGYQTVYASRAGAAAAPTAGLHFTPELRGELGQRGIEWTEITLHAGYGTFSPVREADIRRHEMHAEYVVLEQESAEAINRAIRDGRPVVAVGTTSLRAIEGVFQTLGRIAPYEGWINIFIYPGRPMRVIDQLITNFHLPESSLLMLVSALAGRERILDAYRNAASAGYLFFSYGDAMLITYNLGKS